MSRSDTAKSGDGALAGQAGSSQTAAGRLDAGGLNAYARQALLPDGFRDLLPPDAEWEADTVAALMTAFHGYGYDRVAPPLVEYEDSLLHGPGAKHGQRMFRLMDPDTQKVMAVRADITTQMSRLAATRLAGAPRPLRLAYAGNVLRTKGSQLRPTRQFVQVGAELVGHDGIEAEMEVIALAVAALGRVGLEGISVDLTLAPLGDVLLDAFELDGLIAAQVREALAAKDMGAIETLEDPAARGVFSGLIRAAGPAERCLSQLHALDLPSAAQGLVRELSDLVAALVTRLGDDVPLTVDPCETHGFEYKTGIGFALFARQARGEIGRGGRYGVLHADGHREGAAGFSVYLDVLMEALPDSAPAARLFIPYEAGTAAADAARAEGWRVLAGLSPVTDAAAEARRLGCDHWLTPDGISPVTP
ncbi:ATP phosphoribosyltransferase regulatory subunit [Yunchengibacter salinarum]|uniref:ATP phosphoribosyltransferase regulatory subunit n=1 Tax=Yunchengibacter salinarum TaxID=3133399 RepID=UPI0035B67F85